MSKPYADWTPEEKRASYERLKIWRQNNKDKAREQSKRYWDRHAKERIAKNKPRVEKWVREHPERVRELGRKSMRRQRELHPEKMAERNRENARKMRQHDPERIRENERRAVQRDKARDLEGFLKRQREASRRKRERHPERVREQSRDSARRAYEMDPDKHKEKVKQWRADNPEIAAATEVNSRAKRAGAEGHCSASHFSNLRVQQNNQCAFSHIPERLGKCLVDLRNHPAHRDHWIPLAKGGTNWPDNMRFLLCGPCNSWKASKTPDQISKQLGRDNWWIKGGTT